MKQERRLDLVGRGRRKGREQALSRSLNLLNCVIFNKFITIA